MGIVDEIKKDHNKKRIPIQSSEGERLSKILNRLFYLPRKINLETEFLQQVMTRGEETQERAGLHASAMLTGDKEFCLRQQVLSLIYKQLQGEQLPVNLLRIFEEGNAVHEKWQRLFIRGGYSFPAQLDYTHYNEKYKLFYTPDVICTIEEFYDGPMVGEIKSVNTFQFQKMARHPSAWKQCQFYMFLTGLSKGFVLSEDKNNQEFKCEIYDYEKKIIAPYIERCEQVQFYYEKLLDKHKLVKRPEDAAKPDCKRCESCPMREACWGIGDGKQLLDNVPLR